ncbi:MAG: zinc ribbon domain-containing protein [Myxococcales bacterium]|nr:zinc ribbon domain-containing protein [Myxococcales bacterium]MCB9648027.1 zinc ribbon domain-containing protein [Deltaproteobacteria bacterium]
MNEDASCPACGAPIGQGRFCSGCGVPLAESNPFEAPHSAPSLAPTSPSTNVKEVAKLQRYIILLIVATGGLFALNTIGVSVLDTTTAQLLAFGVLAVGIVLALLRIILVYRMAVAVGISVGWAVVAAVCGFHPFAGLIALLVVNARANSLLKQAGLRVGLFGVSAADLRALP